MKGILIQEFKTLIKSPSSFSILIIPIVLIVGLGYLIPSGWIVPSAITIGIVGAVLLYFGGSLEEIKRTSFIKSISLTKLNKFTFLLNKVLFSIFISFVSILWVLFFGWFFTEVPYVNFLTNNFENLLPDSGGILSIVRTMPFSINWEKINWPLMFYSGIMTIVISISISFVFVAFSKSSLSFYLMSFGYLLAMILFGGVVMPSFLISSDNEWFKTFYYFIPNFYTNNVMAESFGNGLGKTIGSLTKPIINNATEDNIYLGSILNSLSGQLDKILSDTVLKDVIKDHNSLSQSRLDEINTLLGVFFESGKNFGDLSLLDSLNKDNKYEEFIFNILNLPDKSGFKSWHEMIKKLLSDNLNLGFFQGVVLLKIENIIGPILTNVLKDPSTMITTLIHSPLNATEFKTILSLIDPNLSLLIPDSVESIQLWSLLDIFSGEIPKLINGILPDGGEGEINLPSILNLISTLDGMFNTATSIDYVIPWVETIGFLGIAVVFFKWS